ncbi:HAD family hydrolase [Rickettsia bellii]|uniref:HAD-superfamily subfamily IIA hydrolase n=3 Tax=Rickettsia bellii TaxID=33990 RepID=Q1RHT7_RICBR|nr:TIGR01459 family HAD-type hydrolase [Rickettsia bellii]ABE05077.1 HAD-superfamily subfamily IIA hydrolase [Rickettsia bellii RML369-C]ABV79088.1 HAD-superfamily subfamily IIA hydrolase [Rickettsia bellii OSU 85-389]ARD86546.1 HAD family hydrolase [Rickettsia bellii]KJV89828.1 HAD hydrolase, IIA family protein [Rickettsia bellii str. RML An4]KJV91890.1 HAD hydrolase, IIA family protein [Rickettsia bellii str. RML Mogi]
MDKLKLKNIFDVMDDYDVFLFDLWGVVVEGGHTYPNVVQNINKIIEQKKVYFVTNAPRNIFSLHQTLKSWGLNAKPEMIINSGEVAVQMILESKERFGIEKPIIYHLGHLENDIINGIQCPITDDIQKANILLMTIYRDESKNLDLNEFDELFKIVVERKIVNICANPDLGINQHGIYRYCSGYYAQKIIQLGGKVIYSGKPYEEIYSKVLQECPNIPKNRMLMIGDTFYTDILAANWLGIDSGLVLTGNSRDYHLEFGNIDDKLSNLRKAAEKQSVMPSFVVSLS